MVFGRAGPPETRMEREPGLASHIELRSLCKPRIVFDGVKCIVDVGGGSGTFAIPFALDNPEASVLLLEHPTVAPFVTPYLQRYGVADRVTVIPMDVFQADWELDATDVVFLGNFLHRNAIALWRFLIVVRGIC